MKIWDAASHRHLYIMYVVIGIRYGQQDKDTSAQYERRLLNGTMKKVVLKTTVRWMPISLDMYISMLMLVWKDWRIGRIAFAWRKFRQTAYRSKGIGGRRDGRN
jgi:hypothetical protein